MKTFIKWAGGKENELPHIMSNLPEHFDRYIEPFVGGGATYFEVNKKNSIINDKSNELIDLYKLIQSGNEEFLQKITDIYHNWTLLEKVVENNKIELLNLYKNYCNEMNQNAKDVKHAKQKYINIIEQFVVKHAKEFNGLLTGSFNINVAYFIHETQEKLYYKIHRMWRIEIQKGQLKEENILQNIEGAFKSAYYSYFRYLYNYKEQLNISNEFASAIFYFIREYCYAAMFRYNEQGNFNVPYGGISYNRKDFSKKIEYIKSPEIRDYMKDTKIYNKDFEDFFDSIELNENDFIFLDPPYDTEFSTYAQNNFDRDDQKRLANYLINTKAQFMLIIKNTDFIRGLYEGYPGKIYIDYFDKRYLVSFRNRNDRAVRHLIITNYKIKKNEKNDSALNSADETKFEQ